MTSNSVRIEVLSKENYDTWKLQVEALLVKNDSWDYVNGGQPRPEIISGDTNSETAATLWDDKDRKAKSDLILAISPSELKQIKGCKTSRDVWLKLESIYQSKGPARKATLLKRLTLNKMTEGQDIREHVDMFFDTVDRLEELDLEINRDLLSILLLYSLPDDFENFRCAMESRDELPTPEALKIKIFEEYEARKAKETPQNALLVKKKNTQKNYEKGKTEPKSKTQYTKQNNTYFKYQCHRCKKTGHKAADCWFKPNKNRETASQAEASTNEFQKTCNSGEVALLNTEGDRETKWCLDSGCTSHMCSDRANFQNFTSTEKQLSLANSDSTEIKGIGEVKISVNNGTGHQLLKLKNVLHVPDLRTNLMSVAKITNNGYEVLFRKQDAIILKQNGEALAVAERNGDLYFMRNVCENAGILEIKNEPNSKLEEWHLKLGHLNEKSLKDMVVHNNVYGISFRKNETLSPCEICIKGKQTAKPFPKGEANRTTELLEIIHSDICGPMRTNSLGGARFFATFIDDKSRWGETYFLKNKSEIQAAFNHFKTHAERSTGTKVKILQTDNGKEYCNKEFDDYLLKNGIKRRLTIPYTPQQNGIAERRNRTLEEMARCMMMQAGSPPSFWAEAISTANYIRNRCPTSALNGETPYKIWTGKQPTVGHFQIFGCKVFALDKNPAKGKFDARSKECTFVGYSDTSKGYKLWVPDERRMIVSRDVRFLPRSGFGENYEDFHPDVQTGIHSTHETGTDVEIQFDNPEQKVDQTEEFHESENGTDDEDNFELHSQRGPGRPKIVRSGKRGRPRKEYHLKNSENKEKNKKNDQERSKNQNTEEFANLIQEIDPVTIEEALSNVNALEWKQAVKEEYLAQIKCNTWEVVDRPTDQKVIGNRLVFKTKYDADGEVEKRKARLVAKGYAQEAGVHYNETFAPVAKASSIRLLMALAAEHNLQIHQMDVVTAYLNGNIEEEMHMELPEKLKDILSELEDDLKNKDGTNQVENEILRTICKWREQLEESGPKVCLLKKSLYGLKQSGRQWYTKLDSELRNMGFESLKTDPCIYLAKQGKDIIIVMIYVDDILIASENTELIEQVKLRLGNIFETKDLGPIHYCLGIEFKQNKDFITLSQAKYIQEILLRFGMQDCKAISTPLDPNVKLTKTSSTNREEMQKYPYQQLVGSLMYLAVSTRPDIAYTVSMLSQFNSNYDQEHWIAAKRVLRYLKGTINHELIFQKTGRELIGFADADWGNCIEDRRSYSGYTFILANASVSWEARKQRTVALSTMEAEYLALSEAFKEATYLQNLMKELGFENKQVTIFNDNQSAQAFIRNQVHHSRTKHIDIRHHYKRSLCEQRTFCVKYISTEGMTADILTKGLFKPKHIFCMSGLGVEELHQVH